jgi:hypothetical protein
MTSFTLDTNCLIDVDDDRPAKPFVLALLAAAKARTADVAMVASSASERQPGGGHLANIGEFQQRMEDLGFGHLVLLQPIGRWDLSFYDHCIYASPEQSAREELIFRTLFPNTEPSWVAYAQGKGLSEDDLTSRGAWDWRNRLCDVQAFWTHHEYKRDVFVTSDQNFSDRILKVPDFGSARILTPQQAAALLI